jgi:hypothetical protein
MHESSTAGPARDSIAGRLLVPAFWGAVSIVAIWLAVLFDGIFGGDMVFSNPASGPTTIPSAVAVALFALVGTAAVAKRAFARRDSDLLVTCRPWTAGDQGDEAPARGQAGPAVRPRSMPLAKAERARWLSSAAEDAAVRPAEGTVIDGHADEQVALEVDHIDEALCQRWSVLVRGPAHRVASPSELRRLQEDAAVWPWAGGEREIYMRIIPREVTGRRIELRPAP